MCIKTKMKNAREKKSRAFFVIKENSLLSHWFHHFLTHFYAFSARFHTFLADFSAFCADIGTFSACFFTSITCRSTFLTAVIAAIAWCGTFFTGIGAFSADFNVALNSSVKIGCWSFGWFFCSIECWSGSERKYHAAECFVEWCHEISFKNEDD